MSKKKLQELGAFQYLDMVPSPVHAFFQDYANT